MRSDLLALLGLLSLPLTAQVPATIQADAQNLHLVKQTKPVYPPIAMAAHVSGEVKMQVTIGTDGQVTSSKVLSGPEMLRASATDCVEEWIYDPVLDTSGKATQATAVVSLVFNLNAPGHRSDEKIAERYFPLRQRCRESLSWNEKPAHQAESCTKAAQAAEAFDPGERFWERRDAFVYASTALLRNHESQRALDYADKAVLLAERGYNDNAEAGAAYSVRAQAEAAMGKLPKALDDLLKSEEYERKALSEMTTRTPEEFKRRYVSTLKDILRSEAQILTALGRTEEASAKASEAAKL